MDKEKSRITVDSICLAGDGEWTELSALLTASHLHWNKKKLWYRFPAAYSQYLTTSYDPFLAALLPLAMNTRSELVLNGTVSERLFMNSRQIMKILSGWFDHMQPVDIKADLSERVQQGSKAVGSFFTGGVDSFYTVLKNLELYQNESRITHLIYVHGFDIDVNNQKLFDIVKNEILSAVASLKLEPLLIKTNLREITDRYVRWGEEQHGAALAAAGLCLSSFFKVIYIPSSKPYSQLVEWGSHPLLDPLWSDKSLQFIHDGNEANRSQKISWQLGKSETALKYLRVCWKNTNNSYNCGICGKCVRTKINLKIAGVLENCKTLDNNIDWKAFEDILLKNLGERRNLKSMIELIGEDDCKLKNKLYNLQLKVEKKRRGLRYRLKRFF